MRMNAIRDRNKEMEDLSDEEDQLESLVRGYTPVRDSLTGPPHRDRRLEIADTTFSSPSAVRSLNKKRKMT
jgi:hypothetical protein